MGICSKCGGDGLASGLDCPACRGSGLNDISVQDAADVLKGTLRRMFVKVAHRTGSLGNVPLFVEEDMVGLEAAVDDLVAALLAGD